MTLRTEVPTTRVTLAGVDTSYEVHRVSQVAGARGLNSAEIELFDANDRQVQRLQNYIATDLGGNARCEIFVTPTGGAEFKVHRGRVVANSIQLDGDRLTFRSRLDLHMMCDENWRKNKFASSPISTVEINEEAVFNPVVDGRVYPNRFVVPGDPVACFVPGTAGAGSYWDPTGTKTHSVGEYWTLATAVAYLLGYGNAGQSNVNNPTAAHLIAVLGTDPDLIRNFRIPMNETVPRILDRLLNPFGYMWRVDFRADPPVFQFMKKSSATVTTFKMAAYAADANRTDSPVFDARLSTDYTSRSVNKVCVIGDKGRYESTFNLIPAWKNGYDSFTPEDLTPEKIEQFPDRRRVYRDWVLNEAGEYNNVRAGATIYNFDPIFGPGNWAARRRRFHEMITLGPDGTPLGEWQGCEVEIFDPMNNIWVPLDRGAGNSIQLLTKECGIRFSRPNIASEKIMAIAAGNANNLNIRITASVEGDQRVQGIATLAGTVLSDVKSTVHRDPDSFKFRTRTVSSKYFGTGRPTSSVDDQSKALDKAEELLATLSPVQLRGQVFLHGADFADDFFGKAISGIQPRNITFPVNQPGEPARYPLVTGVTINFKNQTTVFDLGGHNGG